MSPLHLNNPAWQLGVLDTAVHNLDLICWLMGAVPTAVSARSARVNPTLAIDDNVWVSLEFPGGQIVLVTRLCEGQTATVLQLPVDPEKATEQKTDAPQTQTV